MNQIGRSKTQPFRSKKKTETDTDTRGAKLQRQKQPFNKQVSNTLTCAIVVPTQLQNCAVDKHDNTAPSQSKRHLIKVAGILWLEIENNSQQERNHVDPSVSHMWYFGARARATSRKPSCASSCVSTVGVVGFGNVLRGQRAQKTFTTSGYRVRIPNVRTVRCTNLLRKHPRVCTSCNLDVSDIGTRGGRGWTISFLRLEFADFHVFHDVSHLHR